MSLYPLKFEPIYKEKVWGGRGLEKFGKKLPGGPEKPIGESWELVDLPHHDAVSTVSNGPLAGRSLAQVIAEFGEKLLGRLRLTEAGGFPLLVKYLDAREALSIQVHPDAQYAAAHPPAQSKSEAWYVLDAEPGAVFYKGVREAVSQEEFQRQIEAGTVADLLEAIPARPGECHYLPSGTCHALGAGIVVAELQTPSDTTYRVFDWNRGDRELHIEQALACTHLHPTDTKLEERKSHMGGVFTTVSKLMSCDHFEIERVRMSEGYAQEIPYDQPAVWMVLEGRGAIEMSDGPDVEFSRGDTLLIPAGLDDARLALGQDTMWLEVQFPQVRMDLLA